MTKKVQIEYTNKKGKYKLIDVVFEADPEWDNDSYSDEYGKVCLSDYPVLNSEPTYDESLYSEEENEVIKKWQKDNYKELEYMFCKQLINEYKNEF